MSRLLRFLPVVLLFAACGVKGDLRPKGEPVPLAPPDLVLRQQGDEMLLTWDFPTRNQDGSELTDLDRFRVRLYTYQPDRYCPECRDQETVAAIRVAQPGPARIDGKTVYFRDAGLEAGTGYRYRVAAVTESGQVGAPAEARRIVAVPPAAPVSIRAEPLDRGIRLFWRLPNRSQEAGELLGVNIYSHAGTGGLGNAPINIEPIKGNNHELFGLENGEKYRFGLRTVILADGEIIESAFGEIVEAVPESGL